MNLLSGALLCVLLGTLLLSLESPFRTTLVPHAPYLMLSLQLGLGFLSLPFVRIRRNDVAVARLFLILSMFFGYALLSSMWSTHSHLVLQRSAMVFVPVVFIVLLVWGDRNPLRTFQRLGLSLVVIVSGLVAVGLVLYVFGRETIEQGYRVQSIVLGPLTLAQNVMGRPPLLRMSSLTGNPNTLASWIMFAIPFSLYIRSAKLIRPFYSTSLVLLLTLGLLLTFSRTGIAATVVGICIYYYVSSAKRSLRLKRLLVIVGGAAFAFLILIALVTALPQSVWGDRLSLDLNLRDHIWTVLIDAFRDNPLLGVGFGVSDEAVLVRSGIDLAAHSAHLMILVETGLIGYTLFLGVWFLSLFPSFLGLFRLEGERRYAVAAVVAIGAALFVHAGFETIVLRYGAFTLFWAYILAAGVRLLPKRPHRFSHGE